MMIASNAALVLDHCRFEKRNMQGDPNVFLGPQAFLRNNRGINLVGQQPKLLAFESDDAEFIAAVRGEDRKLDERARRIIETLKLDRHAAYWIGLLRHRDEKIRRQAAGRVQALLGQEVAIPEEPKPDAPATAAASRQEIAQAIRELDSDDFRTREQAAGTAAEDRRRRRRSAARNRAVRFDRTEDERPYAAVRNRPPPTLAARAVGLGDPIRPDRPLV